MLDYLYKTIDEHFKDKFINEQLRLVVPSILDYYGEDCINVLVDALRSISVCVCPPGQDMIHFINSTISIRIDNYFNTYLNDSLIASSPGISYTESSYVVYDRDDEEFRNKGRDRKILFSKSAEVLRNSNSSNEIIRMLIYSVVTQMKQMKNNNIIRNGKRITRNGVLQSFHSLSLDDNNKASLNFLSETGRGLSNAMNEFDTFEIYQTITGEEPKKCSCRLEIEILKKLLKNRNEIDLIHKYELKGDIPALRNEFDGMFYSGAFDNMMILFDKIVSSSYRINEDECNLLREEAADFINTFNVVKKTFTENQ